MITPRHLAARIGSLGFALVLATGSLACMEEGEDEASDETGGDGDGDGDPSGDGDGDGHAAAIQPIWDANCVAMCHEAGGTAETILDLSSNGYDNLVGVPSTQIVGMDLVNPGNSADSYLIHKLRGTQVDAGGLGAGMPSGGDPLPETTIAMIEAWIDAGAAP